MGAFFGKSKKIQSRVTEYDKSILQLKQQRDKLKQYQKNIELTLNREREMAKRFLQDGKKDRALLLLRKKKYREQLLLKTDNQLESMEHLVHDLEFSQVEMQVVNGLKAGNEALKKVHELLTVDDVERILEETREGVEKQRELDELLSGALTQEDEDSVEAELEEILKASLPEVPTETPEENKSTLPEVPTESPKVKEKKRKKVALAST